MEPNMLEAVFESCVSILVETSSNTELYLSSLRSHLISFLQNKASRGGFRFNVAHFSRDCSFWDDQVTECNAHTAASAAEWISRWVTNICPKTRRGTPYSGPHTLPALVTAFSDPLVEAVYLASASCPAGSTNDLLQHVRLSSKNRPIHVIFLAQHNNMDYQAMEMLRILSKETNGTFRIAYFDTYGHMSQVMEGQRAMGSYESLHHNDSPLIKFPINTTSDRTSRDHLVNLYNNYFQGANKAYDPSSIVSMKSLPGDSPNHVQTYHMSSVLMANRNPNSHTVGDTYRTPPPPPDWSKLDAQSTVNDAQMSEIRKMFTKLYVGRQKEKKQKPYKAVKAKVYKFKDPMGRKTARERSSSSSRSSSFSSSDLTMSDVELASDLHQRSHRRRTPNYSNGATTRRSWSTVSVRSHGMVDKYEHTPKPGEKPPWRPIGSIETSKLSHGPRTDRTAWLNGWQNERLKKEKQFETNRRTKSVQVGPIVRPQSEDNKLRYTSFTQTPNDDVQTETIRDLVRQNNTLMKALEHKDGSVIQERDNLTRIRQNRSNVLSKIHAAQNAEKRDWEQLSHAAQAKNAINNEIRDLATRRTPFTVRPEDRRPNTIRTQRDRAEQLRNDRAIQIRNAQEHREAVKRQHQQANYKAMYEKLVNEMPKKERNQGAQIKDLLSHHVGYH